MSIRYFLALAAIFVFAQNVAFSQKPEKIRKTAEVYFESEYYPEALELYRQLDSLEPNVAETKYKIGVCYFHSPFETKSLPYFETAERLGYSGPNFEYYFGRADHLNHLFDEAIMHYERYQEGEDTTHKSEIPRLIEQCGYGKRLAEDSLHIIIRNLGPVVNTKYPEYVPIISADESVLIFTARRPSTTGGKIDIIDEQYYEDIYVSYGENGEWSKPKRIGPNINTNKHDACVGLSPDGEKLFIYKTNKSKFGKSGDIWVSTREGDDWSKPIKLGENINTEGWEPSASISADGKTLFFSSNRPGGFGGTDIYYSNLDEHGAWGPPENIGPAINTEYDEDAPFIHVDGKTLYFSSKGHNNMGGYDIFISHYDDSLKAWGAPMNIGYPINTADDDIYFVWSADGTKGYFASYREDSFGDKDLYMAQRPSEASHLIVFKGFVKDKKTEQPLASNIKITDLSDNKLIGVFNSNSTSGKYTIILPHGKRYNITIERDGYLFYSDYVYIPESNHYLEVRKDIYLEPIFLNDSVNTKDSLSEPQLAIGSTMTLNNIFFDFDKATLRPESKYELDNLYDLLKTYPAMYVELSGHTDSLGSHKYNQILSEKRAVAVVKYLVKKGIDKDRMVAVGYGEEKPAVQNSSDSLRQLNRRTELKLIAKDNIKHYSKRVINLNKWKDKNNNHPQRSEREMYIYTKAMKKPKAGQILNLKVHFMFNNFDFITDYSKTRLAKLLALMEKYPEMKLKVHAHADPFGSDTYNQELSENRAETVKKYLVDHGITEDRLEISTYGEELPYVKSDDVRENLHNRRVEFEVVY